MTLNIPVIIYESLPELIVQEVEGFVDSPELQAARSTPMMPGIVLGALGRYVARLCEAPAQLLASGTELNTAFAVLEALAQRGDSETRNAVVTEAFHAFTNSDAQDVMIEALGPASRALYDRWVGLPDADR